MARDVEEKRGYKSVEGVARFLVKRIEDGWLVQSIIGIDGASEAADCDMGYYLVENKEELMVLRISKNASRRWRSPARLKPPFPG